MFQISLPYTFLHIYSHTPIYLPPAYQIRKILLMQWISLSKFNYEMTSHGNKFEQNIFFPII